MKYRHIFTGVTVRVTKRTAVRYFVVDEAGNRMYYDNADFAAQFRAVAPKGRK